MLEGLRRRSPLAAQLVRVRRWATLQAGVIGPVLRHGSWEVRTRAELEGSRRVPTQRSAVERCSVAGQPAGHLRSRWSGRTSHHWSFDRSGWAHAVTLVVPPEVAEAVLATWTWTGPPPTPPWATDPACVLR